MNTESTTNELFDLLKEAKSVLRSLKLSMMAHPDCNPGSEFDDLTDKAEETEYKISRMLKEGPKLVDKDQWISVKDSQPSKNGIYLAWVESEGDAPFFEVLPYMGNEWDVEGWECVTHWMPIHTPEPSKREV